MWGSTWLVIKIGYGGLGPFNVAALRFFLAGLIFTPLVAFFDARWPRVREEWLLVGWVGLALFAADYGLIYWGEQFLDSGLTAILFATLPLITILFAHAYLPGERITLRKLAGTLLAFFGVAGLFGDLLHAAQDVERHEPELHQRLHARNCAAPRIHLSRRAADAADRAWRGVDSDGCNAGGNGRAT